MYYVRKPWLTSPPVDLYLIFEKLSLRNQVERTAFLVYFELDFYYLCSLQKSSLKQTKKSNLIFEKSSVSNRVSVTIKVSLWTKLSSNFIIDIKSETFWMKHFNFLFYSFHFFSMICHFFGVFTPPKNVWCGSFLAVNHHNYKNWVPSILNT